jgi:hypothetical protein
LQQLQVKIRLERIFGGDDGRLQPAIYRNPAEDAGQSPLGRLADEDKERTAGAFGTDAIDEPAHPVDRIDGRIGRQ